MRKYTALLLIFTMALSLCACGSKKAEDIEAAEATAAAQTAQATESQTSGKISYQFQQELYPFGPDCTVKGLARVGQSLMIYGADNGTPVLGIAEYLTDENSDVSFSSTKLLELDSPDDDREARIYAISAGEDGCFYVLTGELPPHYTIDGEDFYNEAFSGGFALLKYSEEGEFIQRYLIDNWPFSDITGLIAAESGIVIYSSYYVSFVSYSSEFLRTESLAEDISLFSASLTADGVILSGYDFTNAQARYYLCDIEGQSLSELSITGEEEYPRLLEGNTGITQGLNGEYLINSQLSIYEYDFAYGKLSELLSISTDANSMSLGAYPYTCRLSETAYACVVKGEEYVLIFGTRLGEPVEQSTVTVAICGSDAENASDTLDALNASGSQYKYEYTSYSGKEIDKLLVEIASGNAPDLVVFSEGLDSSGEQFEDLYPYLESDAELGKDSIIPTFLQALTVNGELHELWNGMEINTLAARTADVEGQSNLTPEFYSSLLAESDQYTAIFEAYMSKGNLLKWVAELGVSIYMDKANATCSFDSASFSELLAWCGEMGDEIQEGVSADTPDISEVILVNGAIEEADRVYYLHDNLGADYSFVGFPIGTDLGNYYACPMGCYRMAIPVNSSNKAGAWSFISQQLQLSTQLRSQYNLPVNAEAFSRAADAALDDGDYELLMGLVERTVYAENIADEQIREEILSVGEAYLAGDKSLDEAASLIQSKASIYMAEQYG